jgi:hypothetical protein
MLDVFDRPTGEHLLVYTPQFIRQFEAGHRTGRWYVRPTRYVGSEPQSPSFSTARSAIEAVRAGCWSFRSTLADRVGPLLRVIWSAPEEMAIYHHGATTG